MESYDQLLLPPTGQNTNMCNKTRTNYKLYNENIINHDALAINSVFKR